MPCDLQDEFEFPKVTPQAGRGHAALPVSPFQLSLLPDSKIYASGFLSGMESPERPAFLHDPMSLLMPISGSQTPFPALPPYDCSGNNVLEGASGPLARKSHPLCSHVTPWEPSPGHFPQC